MVPWLLARAKPFACGGAPSAAGATKGFPLAFGKQAEVFCVSGGLALWAVQSELFRPGLLGSLLVGGGFYLLPSVLYVLVNAMGDQVWSPGDRTSKSKPLRDREQVALLTLLLLLAGVFPSECKEHVVHLCGTLWGEAKVG